MASPAPKLTICASTRQSAQAAPATVARSRASRSELAWLLTMKAPVTAVQFAPRFAAVRAKVSLKRTPEGGGVPASGGGGVPASGGGGAPASGGGGVPASEGGGVPASEGGGVPASEGGGVPASEGGGVPASE